MLITGICLIISGMLISGMQWTVGGLLESLTPFLHFARFACSRKSFSLRVELRNCNGNFLKLFVTIRLQFYGSCFLGFERIVGRFVVKHLWGFLNVDFRRPKFVSPYATKLGHQCSASSYGWGKQPFTNKSQWKFSKSAVLVAGEKIIAIWFSAFFYGL
jgi:hypothetical protein